jgi:hypothetical protein
MRKVPALQRLSKEVAPAESSQLSFELTTQQRPSDLVSPPVIRSTVFDAAHSDPPLTTTGDVIKPKRATGQRSSFTFPTFIPIRPRLNGDEAAEEITNRVK